MENRVHLTCSRPQGLHSHILMMGGRGPSDFLGLKFWPKVIFWVYERCQDFLRSQKKNRGTFLGCKERTKIFF